jgi:hypothetical protein
MAVTRITGTKWIKADTIAGGTAAGEGQIKAGTIDSYNIAADAINADLLDETADYTVNKIDVTSDATVGGTLAVTGDLSTEGNIAGVDANLSGNVVITGNLQVDGDQIIANTSVLEVEDKNITVSKGGNHDAMEGAGITVDNTDGDNGSIIYKDAAAGKFAIGIEGSEIDVVPVSGVQTLFDKTYDLTGDDIAGKSDVEAALRQVADDAGGAKDTLYTDDSAVSDSKLTVDGAIAINSVYVSGIRLSLGTDNDYTVNDDGNEITFADTPDGNIVVDYSK